MIPKPKFFKRSTRVSQTVKQDVLPVEKNPDKIIYRMTQQAPSKPLVRFNFKRPNFPGFSKLKRIGPEIRSFGRFIVPFGNFLFLLIFYVFGIGISGVMKWKFFPKRLREKWLQPYMTFYYNALGFIDRHDADTISRVGLIELAFRNMKAKKTRTIVTIGGMTIGIGAIVFLVSIGYGLQQLVITRVARLSEMKQADISPQTGGKTKMTDKTISDVKGITNVQMSLPLIAVVGRVNYQNSVSDMAVYGVTSDYLKESAIKPVQGAIFTSNDIAVPIPPKTTFAKPAESQSQGEVAGAATEKFIGKVGETIRDLDFTLHPATWTKVRASPNIGSPIIGYTRRVEGTVHGEEVWGGQYISDDGQGIAGVSENGEPLGKWIQSEFFLWDQKVCATKASSGCEDGKYVPMTDDAKQRSMEGYIAEINVIYSGFIVRDQAVLGEQTTASNSAIAISANISPTPDDLSWVDIASEAGINKPSDTKKIPLNQAAMKQAVVNRAMLQVLGLKELDAIGKKFTASFIVVGDLLSDRSEKIESVPSEYTIVAVIPDDKTPVFYVPFIDLRSLGVVNYSQMKVVVNNQTNLTKVRRQIESMGFLTQSVSDTVAQINALFSSLRAVLALLGFVALSVAALGMFNTLTVSLLERTREVGLMKAMGMKSSEVQELFLTESMIMGFFGGIIGLIAGVILGKLFSLLLSILAIVKGVGFVDVSYIPFSFILFIIVLSFIVGILTGIYPARRATKISALDALRYE